jgi:hypothetical protein
MWRGQPYMYVVVRSSAAGGDVPTVAPIDSVILMATLCQSNVNATGVD